MPEALAQRFSIPCPACGKEVNVSTAHVGKKGRCPGCQHVFAISRPEPSAALGLEPLGLQPLPTTPPAPSIWSEAPLGNGHAAAAAVDPDEPRLQAEASPSVSLAGHYLKRASSEESLSLTEQDEREPGYRFWTSWGSIIFGSATILFALFVLVPIFLIAGSLRGLIFSVFVMIFGGGWIVQGLNYVFYYASQSRKR
jgi:hypothetical protein